MLGHLSKQTNEFMPVKVTVVQQSLLPRQLVYFKQRPPVKAIVRVSREFGLIVMTTLLHGQPLIPHRTSSAASLRQLRAPRHFIRPRLLSCTKSKATSTTEKQQQTSEKAQQPPTASQDTTHVQIKTGEPTDPAHVANGSGAKGADMEVDSVLAKELSENGTLYRRCSYYGDKHFGRGFTGV